jgi:hypothetical protein
VERGKEDNGEKKIKKTKREATTKQSAKRSFKEQAGITLRDNSCLLYEVSMFIIN